MNPELALLNLSGAVATLTLNRESARNAMSIELIEAAVARLDELLPPLPEGGGWGVGYQSSRGIGRTPSRTATFARDLPPPPRREPKTMARAQALRKAMTVPEKLLWSRLAGHRFAGLKFRRQHPFGPYILDYYCPTHGLVIELDGVSHLMADAKAHDSRRTEYLMSYGLKVIRVSDDAAVKNLDSAAEFIAHHVRLIEAGEITPRQARFSGTEQQAVREPTPQPPPSGKGEQTPHVLILTGAGGSFCAGMDLKAVASDEGGAGGLALRLISALADFCQRLRRLPMVTIAKVNGAAIGGGCGLATVCDLAVTHADSKMGFPEVDMGVCPAVVAPHLVRKIGAGPARAVLLRGGVMSGQDAWELGIVDQVVPTRPELDGAVDTIAARLATGGPNALRATKSLLNELDGSLDDALARRAAELSARVLSTPEAQTRLRARLK